MTALSGGQAARAGLASLLLSRYDVILLDEPTNDLDLDGLARLEDFVQELRGGTVLVSHDREFLARTVTRVVELDLAQQQVTSYGGGYAGYLAEREVARRHARAQYEEYAQTRAGLEERARTQRAWMEKGVRNARRKATDPDKNIKAFRAESSEKQAAKARQTDRRIERLEVVAEPRKEWELRMEIAAAPRAGAVVAALRGAVVRRGAFTLGPVDLQVDWADRVAITGANGSGKTTLLGALLGRIPLDEGHAALGPGVVVGEVDQARGLFLGGESLLDAFRSAVPGQLPEEARTLLAKFGLGAAHVLRPAGTLSPGERTRAVLALLQARGRQPAGAGRADQPPGPARDRAARGRAGELPGHPAAGHPRPADAGRRDHQPACQRRGREGLERLSRTSFLSETLSIPDRPVRVGGDQPGDPREAPDAAVPAQHLPARRTAAATRGPGSDHEAGPGLARGARGGRARGSSPAACTRRARPPCCARSPDGGVLITDGPFAEGKEHVGGFTVIRAADLDEALSWGRKFTEITRLPVEVRPVQCED